VPWVLLAVVLVLLALVFLALVGLGLWRRVKALGRGVARAAETVGQATDALAELQSAAEHRSTPGPTTASTRPARTRR
jgi:cytochrome c-type biogenesis protein CcmH/NrfG